MVRTIPRECDPMSVVDVSCLSLSTILVDESSFAFDTGSGEGISVHRKDFIYIDESEEAKSSVQKIQDQVWVHPYVWVEVRWFFVLKLMED